MASNFSRPKSKSFRVYMQSKSGAESMMLIMGCLDKEECIKFVTGAKDSDSNIRSIVEISKAA